MTFVLFQTRGVECVLSAGLDSIEQQEKVRTEVNGEEGVASVSRTLSSELCDALMP